MREVLGVLALLAGAGVLLHVNLGQRDRRFKTGYRNNHVPTQMAAGPRLKWTAILWAFGGLCLANATVLAGLVVATACVGGAWIAWTQYPKLWARFQGGAPRNSAFVTARWSLGAAGGGCAAYATALMLGLGVPSASTPPVATAPNAGLRAANSRSGASASTSARVSDKGSSTGVNGRGASRQRAEPAEVVLESTRRASPSVVTPVEVQRSVPALGPADPVPSRSLEAAAVRAPAGTRSPAQRERDEEQFGFIEEDDAAPNDRGPRDLRALGPMRGVPGGVPSLRGSNAAPGSTFNQRFPYTPPSQQRSSEVANSQPSGRTDTYTPREGVQSGRVPAERVTVERGVVVPKRQVGQFDQTGQPAQAVQGYTPPQPDSASQRSGPQGDGP